MSRIGSYVGRAQPVASWAEAAEAVRAIAGAAYPERLDDEAFWDAFARRTFRERDDGRSRPITIPHIALAWRIRADAPPPDIRPLFKALAAKPVL